MIKIPKIKSNDTIWHSKSEKPPRYAKYIVLGLSEFTPDHNGEPDAVWALQTASYSPLGWSIKIKCWAEFPNPPKKYMKYFGKVVHSNNVRW